MKYFKNFCTFGRCRFSGDENEKEGRKEIRNRKKERKILLRCMLQICECAQLNMCADTKIENRKIKIEKKVPLEITERQKESVCLYQTNLHIK